MAQEPNRWPLLVLPLLVVAGGVGWYVWQQPRADAPAVATTAPPSTVAAPTTPPPATVQHPVEAAPAAPPAVATEPPLPALDDSDAALIEAIDALLGGDAARALMRPNFVIQRVVATVDSLTGRKLAPQNLPVEPAGGRFAVAQVDGRTVIAGDNAARYARYLEVLRGADPQRTAALYLRYYPLFQQAYRELGYPDGYFNDRLVVVIDHLLAAPVAPDPVVLSRPKVMYEYADPALETRTAGEKIMMRIGAQNADEVRAWLRAFRAAIAAGAPATPVEDAAATPPTTPATTPSSSPTTPDE